MKKALSNLDKRPPMLFPAITAQFLKQPQASKATNMLQIVGGGGGAGNFSAGRVPKRLQKLPNSIFAHPDGAREVPAKKSRRFQLLSGGGKGGVPKRSESSAYKAAKLSSPLAAESKHQPAKTKWTKKKFSPNPRPARFLVQRSGCKSIRWKKVLFTSPNATKEGWTQVNNWEQPSGNPSHLI